MLVFGNLEGDYADASYVGIKIPFGPHIGRYAIVDPGQGFYSVWHCSQRHPLYTDIDTFVAGHTRVLHRPVSSRQKIYDLDD